jgi:hypothetical protein
MIWSARPQGRAAPPRQEPSDRPAARRGSGPRCRSRQCRALRARVSSRSCRRTRRPARATAMPSCCRPSEENRPPAWMIRALRDRRLEMRRSPPGHRPERSWLGRGPDGPGPRFLDRGISSFCGVLRRRGAIGGSGRQACGRSRHGDEEFERRCLRSRLRCWLRALRSRARASPRRREPFTAGGQVRCILTAWRWPGSCEADATATVSVCRRCCRRGVATFRAARRPHGPRSAAADE